MSMHQTAERERERVSESGSGNAMDRKPSAMKQTHENHWNVENCWMMHWIGAINDLQPFHKWKQ